jgi:hypothetical protein
MKTFTFKFVATTGEKFETTIVASTLNVALIKMTRERRAMFGNDKIWQSVQ